MVHIPSGGVSSSTYYIYRDLLVDEFEVTKELWDSVYNWALAHDYAFDNPGLGKALDHPVHTVNWYDVIKWCNARSEMEGFGPCFLDGGEPYRNGEVHPEVNWYADGYRLPTRHEWNYAGQGGGVLFSVRKCHRNQGAK